MGFSVVSAAAALGSSLEKMLDVLEVGGSRPDLDPLVGGLAKVVALAGEGHQAGLHPGFAKRLVELAALGDRDTDVGLAVDHQGGGLDPVGEEDRGALEEGTGPTDRRARGE